MKQLHACPCTLMTYAQPLQTKLLISLSWPHCVCSFPLNRLL